MAGFEQSYRTEELRRNSHNELRTGGVSSNLSLARFLPLQIAAARDGLSSKLPGSIFCHPCEYSLSILFRNLMGYPLSVPLRHSWFYFVL